MIVRFSLALLVLEVLLVSSAGAQLLPTAQTRSVQATSTTFGDLWQSGSSPEFPSFDPPTVTLSGAPANQTLTALTIADFDATASVSAGGVLIVSSSGTASASVDSVIATRPMTSRSSSPPTAARSSSSFRAPVAFSTAPPGTRSSMGVRRSCVNPSRSRWMRAVCFLPGATRSTCA